MRREVAVVQFLVEAGAPVVPAWRNPGPHLAEGLPVSLWQWVDHEPGELAQPAFGTALGELHRALATYSANLPLLVGPLTDIATALAMSREPVLHRSAEHLVSLAQSWPRRPLHGDAHSGNVLLTPDGPVWTDFEDVCAGPLEWDLASMTITEEALASYPGSIDRARLQDCRDLRRLQVLASLVVLDDQDTALYEDLVTYLNGRPWALS
ncbi:MAG TPA: aminoglycoside phosphotransferase family protein [Mycobacteriales bacterium]|nr:aminoglycoside phosphotransferase family protein [Mycobacteriales bacterium]